MKRSRPAQLRPGVILAIILYAAAFLLVGVASAGSGVPHFIFGKVLSEGGGSPDKDQLHIYAYFPSRPDEILSKVSPGCGYDFLSSDGWLWFEGGNFNSRWSINDEMRIIAVDVFESGIASLQLDKSGNQVVSDLHLAAGDHVGPIASAVKANGSSPLSIPEGTLSFSLTATLDDSICGGSIVAAAEFYCDTDPGVGNGTPMQAVDSFDDPKEQTVGSVDISTWKKGETHKVYVRGQDLPGNWGAAHMVSVSVTEPQALKGDLNNDGCVDQKDVSIVVAARNKPATGPDDPRDLDHDGKITAVDARMMVLLCTKPGCASCK